MTRSAHMIAVVLPLALAACGSELDPADSAATAQASETAVDPARTVPTDDPTRAEPRPDADRGETGARAVLLAALQPAQAIDAVLPAGGRLARFPLWRALA